VSGKLIGMGGCLAALSDLRKATAVAVGRRALLPAAEVLRAAVEARAPQDTGDLKRSIVIDKRSQAKRRRKGAVEVSVYANDIAAVTNEFGTSDTPMQPFFRPAVEAEKQAMFDAVARDLQAETIKAAKRAARKAPRG
jgi:HK97 gp10 family phage protein